MLRPGSGDWDVTERAWPEVNDVEFKVVLSLPRDAASVPLSRQVLDGCLETLGVTDDTRDRPR